MPPSLVDRPLMPCPPRRTASGDVLLRGRKRAPRRPPPASRGAARDRARRRAGRWSAPTRSRGRRVRRRCPRATPGAVVGDAVAPRGQGAGRAPHRRMPSRPRPARAATASRSAGATSSPEALDRGRGSSLARMKLPMPFSQDERQQLVHCSRPAGSLRRWRHVEQPADLARVAAGLGAASSMMRVAAARPAGLQVGQRGQPAVGLPADQPQHPRLEAPSQIGMSCGGRGPRLAPATRWYSPSTRRGAGRRRPRCRG